MKALYSELIKRADSARKAAYCPYSGFSVGAAILTKSGNIYTGANIENASYPAGICAERVAIGSAISSGEREFVAVAISGGRAGNVPNAPFYPCGICRQVLAEFADEIDVITASKDQEAVNKLSQLLPYAFDKRAINDENV